MRALTLWQPWAWAMSIGLKRIENRSWEPPAWLLGEHFALHASMKWDRASHETLEGALIPRAQEPDVPDRLELVYGAVVATCRLSLVVTSADAAEKHAGFDQRRWFMGPYGWVVGDVRQLAAPVSCRGYQGLWNLPPDVLEKVQAQL